MADGYDSLKQCVEDLGGNKVVGCLLRPALSAKKAQDWMSHCLNPKKRDKLDPNEIQFIQRLANHAGKHTGNAEWNLGAGYRLGETISPKAEMAQLRREAEEAEARAHKASQNLLELFSRMRASNLKVDEL